MQTTEATCKAMEAARVLSRQRLSAGAKALADVLPTGGVLLAAKLVRWRCEVNVLLVWPGVLLELDSSTGEVLAQTPVADMFDLRPESAALMCKQSGMRDLACTTFTHAGELLRASIDVRCIVRVRALRSKDSTACLAMSEPGRPDVLYAPVHVAPPQDFTPSQRPRPRLK